MTRVRIPLKRLPGSCHTLPRGVGMRSLAYERRASRSHQPLTSVVPTGVGPITAHLHVAPMTRAIARGVQKDPATIRGWTLLERPSSADVKRFKWRRAADENRMICARQSVANMPRLAKVPSFLWRDWNVSLTAALARVNDPLSSGGITMLKRMALALGVLAGLGGWVFGAGALTAAGAPRAYVGLFKDDAVAVIDTVQNKVLTTI